MRNILITASCKRSFIRKVLIPYLKLTSEECGPLPDEEVDLWFTRFWTDRHQFKLSTASNESLGWVLKQIPAKLLRHCPVDGDYRLFTVGETTFLCSVRLDSGIGVCDSIWIVG